MTMQYVGLGIYYLFLALSGGYFFAVIPTPLLYLVANFKPEPVKVREISYQDVLYFKSKAELLDFLRTGQVKRRKEHSKWKSHSPVFGRAFLYPCVCLRIQKLHSFLIRCRHNHFRYWSCKT